MAEQTRRRHKGWENNMKTRSNQTWTARFTGLAVAATIILTFAGGAGAQTWDGGGTASGWGGALNWDADVTPAFDNTTDIIFNTAGAARLSNFLVANRTIRSLTFNSDADSAVTIRLTTTATGTTAASPFFEADSGDATITVNADSTGNHTIGVVGTSGQIVLVDNLVINHDGQGTLTFARRLNQGGNTSSVTKNGTGKIIFANDTSSLNNYASFIMNAGTVENQSTAGFGGNAVTFNGGTILCSVAIANNVEVGNTGDLKTWQFSGTGNTTYSGNFTLNETTAGNFRIETTATGNLFLDGLISGAGGIEKIGTGGFLRLGQLGANTFTGNTKVTAGELRLNNLGAIQNSALDMAGSGFVTANASAGNYVIGGLISGRDLASVITGNPANVTTLTLNPQSGSVTYNNVISDLSTDMALAKTGAGTQVLGGGNTYTGTTTVNGGTLVVNGVQTSATGAITVGGAGATGTPTLGGTGTLGGAVTIATAGGGVAGTLAPGDVSSAGTLNLNSTALTLESGAQLTYRLGTTSDSVAGVTTLTLNGQQWSDFTFTEETGFADGVYVLIAATGTAGSGLGATVSGSMGGGTYTGTLSVDGNSDLILTVASGSKPSVTIDQAAGQLDPTNAATINFTVVFSDDVTGFDGSDVTLDGTAGATTALVTGGPSTYNVAVSGMTGDGTVTASIGADVVDGDGNYPSTSTDNEVTYDAVAPSVTISQAAGQLDPTNTTPVYFAVLFSEPVSDFVSADVTLSGTAGATTAVVTETAPNDSTTYQIDVSGMTGDGTVIVTIEAGKAHDAASNPNTASTGDNEVTYDTTAPTVTFDDGDTDNTVFAGETLTYTVQFDEDIDETTVLAAAFTNAGAGAISIGAITEPTPGEFSVPVTPQEAGTLILQIAASAVIKDLAGNQLVVPTNDNDTVTVNVPPSDYYVKSDGNDASNGTSWAEAFLTINKAVTTAKSAVQYGAANVTVYVGAGTFTAGSEQLIDQPIALIGGTQPGQEGVECRIQSPASYRVFRLQHAGARLDTLTVHNGYTAAGVFPGLGGNIYMTDGVVTNCVVQNGNARANNNKGGGIYMSGGLVVDSVILANHGSMQGSNYSGYGGGVYMDGGMLKRCRVSQNYFNLDSRSNTTGFGAGVCVNNASAVVENCLINGNYIPNQGDVDSRGGGMHMTTAGGVVRHTTIVDNSCGKAGTSGGGFYKAGSAGTVINSVVAINTVGGAADDLAGDSTGVTFSMAPELVDDTDGNIGDSFAAPVFTNAAAGDFTLVRPSPGIDDGTDAGVTDDINGDSRPIDGDGDKTAGYDMGAYESPEYVAPPVVTNVSVNDALLTDADAGAGNLTVTVAFDSVMDTNFPPSLVFSPAVSSTLVSPVGGWSAGSNTYTVAYTVADAGTNVPNVTIGVTGAQSARGPGQADYTPQSAFSIDTENPLVMSVTVNDIVLTVTDVGPGTFIVSNTFSEAMDTGTTPSITFNPALATTLINPSGAWSAGDTIYSVTYDVVDNDDDLTGVTIDISGAKDASGNDQADYTPEAEFDINTATLPPAVTNVSVSDMLLSDADVGDKKLTVTVDFDLEMKTDGSADPNLIFAPLVDTTLTLDNGVWTDNDTWTAQYDVTDAGTNVPNVTIDVVGAQSVGGTPQQNYAESSEFSIDTENPSLASVTVSDTLLTDADTGAGTFIVSNTFNQAMNTGVTPVLTFNPAVATTLGNPSGAWSAGDTVYTVTYDVSDAGTNLAGVTIGVTEAQDANGNPQETYVAETEFSVDTENPSVTFDDGDPDDTVTSGDTLTYTVVFSEEMDAATVGPTSFTNASTAGISIGAVTESLTTPGEFSVEVNTLLPGDLVLQIPVGAEVKDIAGNLVAAPTNDNDTVTVNVPPSEYYVKSDGNDASNGTSWAEAFLTITKAVTTAKSAIQYGAADATIYVGAGTFTVGAEQLLNAPIAVIGGTQGASAISGGGVRRVFTLSDAGARLDSLTITSGYSSAGLGGNILMSDGLVTNCVVQNGTARDGARQGGGIWMNGGTVADSVIAANETWDSSISVATSYGAGVYMEGGQLLRCTVRGNYSTLRTSDIVQGVGVHVNSAAAVVENCVIRDNYVTDGAIGSKGAGVYLVDGALRHCTIVENRQIASSSGAGLYKPGTAGTVVNCVIANNTANGVTDFAGDSTGVTYSMAPELGNGTAGNIGGGAALPVFSNPAADDFILVYPSPGIDDGSDVGVTDDINGDPRPIDGDGSGLAAVDMGAYESPQGVSTFLCDFSLVPTPAKGLNTLSVDFEGTVTGPGSDSLDEFSWDFGDGATTSGATASNVTHVFGPGAFTVTLTVSNSLGAVTSKTIADVVQVLTNTVYVAAGAANRYPYNSWSNAASSLVDAVNAAKETLTLGAQDATVYVSNGTFTVASAVVLNTNVTVIGMNRATSIVRATPDTSHRVFSLTHGGARLESLTIENGFAGGGNAGGGVNMTDGMLVDCVIRDNVNRDGNGGGLAMSGGTAEWCVISNNYFWISGSTTTSRGGGAYVSGGVLRNSVITHNRGDHNTGNGAYGGGLNVVGSGIVESCLVKFNSLTGSANIGDGGGVYLENGTLRNCTVVENSCTKSLQNGGGVYQAGGTMLNTIVWDNTVVAGTSGTNYYGTGGSATYSCAQELTGGAGNRIDDPLFVEPAAGNVRLQALTSLCVDAGQYDPAWMESAMDLDGVARRQGVVDMGAYETVGLPKGTLFRFR